MPSNNRPSDVDFEHSFCDTLDQSERQLAEDLKSRMSPAARDEFQQKLDAINADYGARIAMIDGYLLCIAVLVPFAMFAPLALILLDKLLR